MYITKDRSFIIYGINIFRESNDVDKPVLRQVPVAKVTQDNNSTEQPQTDDDCKEFVPGSIHKKEVREFWWKELKAGDWVLNVLEEGYIIPFTKASRCLRRTQQRFSKKGSELCPPSSDRSCSMGNHPIHKQKPHCVSPLTVFLKGGKDGSIKKRLF